MDPNMVIVLAVCFTILIVFVAGGFYMLQIQEKKKRYKDIIQKSRKIYIETQQRERKKGRDDEVISAKDSMASLYKMQNIAGKMGENLRAKLLQAGIRNPDAPIKFMIAQALIPLFLAGLAMMIISGSDKEISKPLTLLIIMGAAFFGYKLPSILVKNQAVKRQEEINLTFPDALDMMLICVQGGIGLEQTVDRVAREVSGHSKILSEELGILSAEMAMLNDRKQALRDFGNRVGSGAAKNFSMALIQAEQYGTSVSQAMRVLADELRDMRMAAAEQKAAALPPKLTVPMILFFLPALFVIILGPAGIQAAASTAGGG